MATDATYTVKYRRQREGKTNYKLRLKLLISQHPRLVVRRSGKHISLQIIEYGSKGDSVLLSSHSRELLKLGWKANTNSISAAYLTGLLLGAKSRGKKIPQPLMPDIGFYSSVKGCMLYAAIKGVNDSGLKASCSPEVYPKDDRIKGKHIADLAAKLKNDKDKYARQFSACLKKGLAPEMLPAHFDEVKKKIEASAK
jgi:large subunit ribosomal protein L18